MPYRSPAKAPKTSWNSTLESVRSALREIVLAAKDGALIGSEDWLVSELRASRSTLRQAARLLEREGLLRVRRGIKGGYFGARPNEKTIQSVMASYLDTLDMKYEDVTVVASVLWVEVLRRAAALNNEDARKLAEYHREKLLKVGDDATFHDLVEIEQASREAIFDLVKSRYIQLIFHINEAFSVGRFPRAATRDGTPQHRAFVRTWRDAKLLELNAIAQGDVELSVLAARHARSIWHRRVWSKRPG